MQEKMLEQIKEEAENQSQKKWKAQKQNEREMELWIKLQTQIQYNDDVIENCSSLKNILKKRLQFNKEAQKMKTKIEKRRIGNKERKMYHQKWVSGIFYEVSKEQIDKQKQGFMVNPNEEPEVGWGMSRVNQLYLESILRVKDEYSFYCHGKLYRFSKNSLGILDNKTKVRWCLVWLVTWKWFETIITSLILINSLFLGIKDYTDEKNETDLNQFVESLEPFFTYIFFFECLCKIFAMGLILGG